MASKSNIILTTRDRQILNALLKTPLDVRQLLAMSQTFDLPFSHDRLVRRRMQKLTESGLVSRYQYATFDAGSLNYYKLTRLGYRVVQQADTKLPSRAFFGEVSFALQEHTRALADFVVRLHISAMHNQVGLSAFYRENQLQLSIGNRSLQPDAAFQLQLLDGRTLNFLVEVDCGNEPLRATKQRESLMQKVRFYDEYHDRIEKRFIVLFVFTKASSRVSHFLDLADETICDPNRTLIYAGLLPHLLQQGDLLANAAFLNRRGNVVSMLPQYMSSSPGLRQSEKARDLLADVPTIW